MAKVNKGPQGAITTAAHKARRIAKEAARQAMDAVLAPHRRQLRKLGALRRIDCRIAAASESQRQHLQTIRLKVAAAAGAR